MMRYLDPTMIAQAVRARGAVEQWLGARTDGSERVVRWLRIDREPNDEYSVTIFESLDDGDADFLDVYEFVPLDVDSPHGQSTTFTSVEEAIDHSEQAFGADPARFVSAGVIQDEYADYVRTRSAITS